MQDMKWYIVNTHSGSEQIAKKAILERIKTQKMEESFGEILIPQEEVATLIRGKKGTRSKKFFPGYMFIQMVMTDPAWHLVRESAKVSGFVGGGGSTAMVPAVVPEDEVQKLTQQMESGVQKAKNKVIFTVGEEVTVTDGPFSNFNGTVEDFDENKEKVKVLVSIFGRPTPVELDFIQVKKES
ncbi:MAG: transcription termination/antitermination protein NusG [Bdellovibrionaceae bacterium]|jgi:transcription termination/antitermination protein NusG|nr:transcription termination/antitermination protein NusG [Pseudobdellovibrionaceae bacterium]